MRMTAKVKLLQNTILVALSLRFQRSAAMVISPATAHLKKSFYYFRGAKICIRSAVNSLSS